MSNSKRTSRKAKSGVSKLGREIRKIREQIEASGEPLLNRRQLEREVAERRGARF